MRRRVLLTAAIVAAVFLFVFLTLPPRPVATAGSVDEEVSRRTVTGAFHVHSSRSDGTGSVDEIAAAAARAGLRFVIVTDHGDALDRREAPQYRNGVLMIDAVEISTNQGHVVAFDMPTAPYPLGGEAGDVIDDIQRLGGFAIAAHPDSAKTDLQWAAWDTPLDGLEWLSLDSEWRDESRGRIARSLIDYPFGRGPAIAALLDRPSATLDRWDAMTRRRAVVALPAHDAHGGIAEGAGRSGFRARLGVPSYEASFHTFAIRAVLSAEPTGAADRDAEAVASAIRHGRVFSAIDAIAAPAFVDFRAAADGVAAVMGETIPYAADARVMVRSTVPHGGRIVLLRDGREVAQSETDELNATADAPGAYRVEVRRAASTDSAPWIVTNPIYFRAPAQDHGPLPQSFSVISPVSTPARVEKDPSSSATLSANAKGFAFEYALRAGERMSQYAAAAVEMPPGVDARGLQFDAQSSSPMRVSVQLRFGDQRATRWARSVYVSPESQRLTVPFAEFVLADGDRSLSPSSSASSILFVVDLTNARPGLSGSFEIAYLSLVR